MAQVKISSEFFENEIRNYSNWEMAFWRELFQNSIDAGSTSIDVKLEKSGSFALVSFKDNGNGMDRDILENVFFNLGTTTKNSSDSVGGFGRARIILCFAQTDYQIFTNNVYVMGSGANYEINDDWSYNPGCKFVITVPLNKFYSDFSKFELALYDYLSLSKFNAKVKINNVLFDNYLHTRGKRKELSFGVAYANKSSEIKNKIVFRVNGVSMFSKHTSAPILVVVEIDPKESRKILLSNRDSLTWRCQDEVDEFCDLIAKETISAFRDKADGEEIIVGTSRKFISKSNFEHNTSAKYFDQVDINNLLNFETTSSFDVAAKSSITDGLVVFTKSSDKRIRAAARNFSPDKLEASGSRKMKLLKQWVIACEAALESLCKINQFNEIDWRPGLVFDETMEACHKTANDGSHMIMLNPVYCSGENTGKVKFSITNFESHVALLTLAAHEVSHCIYRYHDETFASLFTDIVSDMMKNVNKYSKEMKLA